MARDSWWFRDFVTASGPGTSAESNHGAKQRAIGGRLASTDPEVFGPTSPSKIHGKILECWAFNIFHWKKIHEDPNKTRHLWSFFSAPSLAKVGHEGQVEADAGASAAQKNWGPTVTELACHVWFVIETSETQETPASPERNSMGLPGQPLLDTLVL